MDPIKTNLSISLASELTQLSRLYRSAVDQSAHRCDLTLASSWPIVLIGRAETGIRHGVLAEQVGVEAPSLIRVIDRLVADNLVSRNEDPLDRRAKILCLTETGRQHADQVEALLAQLRIHAFDGLPIEDIEVCLRVFAHLRLSLEQFIKDGPQ